MTTPAELAGRLLDAHTDHVIGQLVGGDFAALSEGLVDQALDIARTLLLDDVVRRDQIKSVARRYASEMDLAAAIPEIAGEIAARLVHLPMNDVTELQDVVGRPEFESWLRKAAELHSLRTEVFEVIERNAVIRTYVTDAIQSLINDFLKENRERVGKIPGLNTALGFGGTMAGLGGSVAGKVRVGNFIPDPAKELDQRTRAFAEQAAHNVLKRAGAAGQADLPIVEIGLELYDEHASHTVAWLRELITLEDVEDVIVLAYEFWRGFRQSAQFLALLDAGVDLFFDHYGQRTLADLLDEFGVSREDLLVEASRFAPPILALLNERGVLRDVVRGQLEGFYASAEAHAVLGGAS